MTKMNYAQRVSSATANILAISVITAFFGYFLKIYFARNLSVEEFGLFYAVLSLTSLVFLLKDLGLGPALVKYLPEFVHKKDYTDVKSAIVFSYIAQFFVGIVIVSILFFNSNFIANNFLHSQNTAVLAIMLVEVIVSSTTIKYSLQGMQFVRSYALMELIRTLFVMGFSLFLVSKGATGVAISFLLASIAVQIMFAIYIFSKLQKKGTLEIRMKTAKKITKFGYYFLFGGMAGFLISYTDTVILTAMRTLTEVGTYQTALSTSQVLCGIATTLAIVLMPIISEMWVKNEREKVAKGISFLLKYIILILIPLVLFSITFSEIIINLVFGSKYLASSLSLQILSFGSIFYSLMTIYSTTLISIGRPDITTKITVFVGVLNLVLNIILIQVFGIMGAAVATTTAYVMGFFIYHRNFKNTVKVSLNKKDMYKIFISAFLSLGVIYALKEILFMDVFLESFITVIIGITSYIFIVLKMGIIKKDEVELIKISKIPIPNIILKILEKNSRSGGK